ncbi:MAG: hypothetical protein AAB588_06660 [Patescibacteria group bacterium]
MHIQKYFFGASRFIFENEGGPQATDHKILVPDFDELGQQAPAGPLKVEDFDNIQQRGEATVVNKVDALKSPAEKFLESPKGAEFIMALQAKKGMKIETKDLDLGTVQSVIEEKKPEESWDDFFKNNVAFTSYLEAQLFTADAKTAWQRGERQLTETATPKTLIQKADAIRAADVATAAPAEDKGWLPGGAEYIAFMQSPNGQMLSKALANLNIRGPEAAGRVEGIKEEADKSALTSYGENDQKVWEAIIKKQNGETGDYDNLMKAKQFVESSDGQAFFNAVKSLYQISGNVDASFIKLGRVGAVLAFAQSRVENDLRAAIEETTGWGGEENMLLSEKGKAAQDSGKIRVKEF